MRIGYGYDAHRFTQGNHLTIGGVKIPYSKGIQAHSDGDVLLHAIGDALLGAAALGDLGEHFPDSDNTLQGISSHHLLHCIMQKLKEKNYKVNNLDSTILLETPKLTDHKKTMSRNIAHLLNIPTHCVSIKASTHEKMGCIGREEGIAAHAILLLSVCT